MITIRPLLVEGRKQNPAYRFAVNELKGEAVGFSLFIKNTLLVLQETLTCGTLKKTSSLIFSLIIDCDRYIFWIT